MTWEGGFVRVIGIGWIVRVAEIFEVILTAEAFDQDYQTLLGGRWGASSDDFIGHNSYRTCDSAFILMILSAMSNNRQVISLILD